jgi:16S rRNA (adenine1518-N6/adenine1519-N6)-dimethyltransferase
MAAVKRPAELLRAHGLRPKKECVQNFLGDPGTLDSLAALASVRAGDTVVELGAGLGHLTRALLDSGARVVAVERDRDLAPILRAELPAAEVVEADAKSFDLSSVAAGARVVVCGNLPYHLSSPILFHLLDQRRFVRRAVLLLQREVAERIAAEPGGREYGVLSVLVQQVANAYVGLAVDRHAFTPPPGVDSSALVIDFPGQPRAGCRTGAVPQAREGRLLAAAQDAVELLSSSKERAPPWSAPGSIRGDARKRSPSPSSPRSSGRSSPFASASGGGSSSGA